MHNSSKNQNNKINPVYHNFLVARMINLTKKQVKFIRRKIKINIKVEKSTNLNKSLINLTQKNNHKMMNNQKIKVQIKNRGKKNMTLYKNSNKNNNWRNKKNQKKFKK